ncbi:MULTISPECIES: hypothetical protein [unclassified Virgibacillus]|uniref:hypothetical protein n=1 Tax=unclassified Virgibacillus TaxID=2620237 RepID=UPI0024DE1D30|nr:hypothetical protein [Virgibacillus sp. LDC-1]
MFMELLTELINETSPFYFYLSIMLSAISSMHFIHLDMHRFVTEHNKFYTKKASLVDCQPARERKPLGEISEVQHWIFQKAMRMDGPDDDTDGNSFCFFNQLKKKQGGSQLQWQKNLYSHSNEVIYS